ncbi:hypothetical protein GCM10027035_03740 [Emticicia sediminis]
MRKIILFALTIIASLSGFSQSVTILPTSTLGGAGSSQWTTAGNNIHYGVGNTNNVGIGIANPVFPLVVRSNGGDSNQPVFLIERANNLTPNQGFVKFGGTVGSPTPLSTGEMGLIIFGGSTSNDFDNWGIGSSIRAVAKGTFSNTSTPGQLEFATTPTGSNSTLLTRMTINEEGKIGINNNTPIAQLDLRYDGSSFHSVHNPMLNIKGPTSNPVYVRYSNSLTTNFSILQEASPGIGLNSTNIRWRWYDNASPSQGTTMFEWVNSSFNVTGALNATGNASIGGNISATGTSALTGKVTVGSSTATTAGIEIRSQTSTDANPDVYFKGTNNVLRFGNNVDGTSLVQTSLSNNTPNSASIAWKHISNANPAVVTPMMSLQGDGDLTVNGFTQLGADATTITAGVTRSSPAMKTILLTGNIAAGATVYTTSVPHGLNAAKIVEVKVLVSGLNNFIVSENYVDNRTTAQGAISGYQFATFTDATNVYILRHQTNGSNINNANGLISTYRILITYIQ